MLTLNKTPQFSQSRRLGIRLYTLDEYLTRFFLIPELKPAGTTITKQECVAKEVGTKTFEVPVDGIKDGAEVSFYCKEDDCNKDQAIKDVLKEDGAKTEAAMKAAGATVEKQAAKAGAKLGPKTNGAAQTTVAVATIAFSMIMARLAL